MRSSVLSLISVVVCSAVPLGFLAVHVPASTYDVATVGVLAGVPA